MSALRSLPGQEPRRTARLRAVLGQYVIGLVSGFQASSRPVRLHIADHAYTLVGLGCISAASFVHSVFSGLLVTGILALVFEWKVSE